MEVSGAKVRFITVKKGTRFRRVVWKDWVHLLGIMPDKELAVEIGCHRSAVSIKRRELGIPAYRFVKPENVEIECACGCGSTLWKYDDRWRARAYLLGHWPRTQEKSGKYERWGSRGQRLKYPAQFFERRDAVLARDECRCRICGELFEPSDLAVHHIDYNPNNNEWDNLVTLCFRDHAKTNIQREKWQAYFEGRVGPPDVEVYHQERQDTIRARRSARQRLRYEERMASAVREQGRG